MAGEENDLEAFFLNSIPSLFRKLSEICTVIINAGEDLIQLLDLMHEEVNGLNGQFQDLCNTQRKWDSRVHWNSLQGQAGQDFISPKK